MSNQVGFRHTATFTSVIDGADLCEHVTENGLAKAVGYFYERDSFGFVSVLICCEECREEIKKAEDATLVCCFDCKKQVLQGQTVAWKWYDFYAAQGDEPYIICNECRVKDTHKARVAKDNKEHGEEMYGNDDQDDDNDCQLDPSDWGSKDLDDEE